MTALSEAGIRLKRETVGTHRLPCPRCAEDKRRPRDGALAVTIEPSGGAVWCCHRCRWTGAIGAPGDRRPVESRRKTYAAPAREPAPAAPTFADVAAPIWNPCQPVERDTPAGAYTAAEGARCRWKAATCDGARR
jgi:twinkle protein